MKSLVRACTALVLVSAGFTTAHSAPIFPETGASTMGPAIIIDITNSGLTVTQVSHQTYDGADDVLVGLINDSSTTQTSISLTGSGNGGGIFGFDGDGIINYIDARTGMLTVGNPNDPTGYAGPGVTFSNYSSADNYASGTVNFDLAAGDYTYFGLEGSPDSISQSGGLGVPEPYSWAILTPALAALGFVRRRTSPLRG